ncbi:MAG: hypothetical protein FWG48_03965 [Oscillospiraceae bacterium]|nr:hypothetical protein [Oscillospiraceae bacterium]
MHKYYMMNAQTRVMSFDHDATEIGNIYSDFSIDRPDLLPPVFRKADNMNYAMTDWVQRRTIPVNRHHMEAVLGAVNLEDRFDLLKYCHGLSLNDTYWVQAEDEGLSFDAINLYDNPFDEALGWIAFTGLPSNISRNLSSPELTTEGMLPKYWQRLSADRIILCKGGTEGYSNAGLEPYAEVIAYLVARQIGVNSIPYHLEIRNDRTVSISRLFTTKESGLLTANHYLLEAYPGYSFISLDMALAQMRNDFDDLAPFYAMCFFDHIIENGDRHLNNWGFSVDNATQKITGFSPLWDNGAALFHERADDMRTRFVFASFDIRYDFLKTCQYRRDLNAKARRLITAIGNGSLERECMEAVKGFERYELRVKPTLAFVESRCREFLADAE